MSSSRTVKARSWEAGQLPPHMPGLQCYSASAKWSSISISLPHMELPERRTGPGSAQGAQPPSPFHSLSPALLGPGLRVTGRQGGLLREAELGLALPAQRAGVTHAGRLTLQHPPFPASSCLKAQWAVTQLSGRGMEIKASSLSLHGVPFCTCPDTGVSARGGGEAGAEQCSCQADQQAHLFWAGQPCRPSLPQGPSLPPRAHHPSKAPSSDIYYRGCRSGRGRGAGGIQQEDRGGPLLPV